MPESSFNTWIDRYSGRVRLGDFLHAAAEWGAGYLLAFGSVVLVVKLGIPQVWPHVLWLGLGLVPAWGAAWWFTRGRSRSREESIARLDAALQSGGLLMTLSERPQADWAQRLPQAEQLWRNALPRIRPRRFARYLALPLLFAVGACFIPLREGTSASRLENSVGHQAAQELEALLEEIAADKLLEEAEQEQLKEEVAKLADETRDTPLTHEKWETVDALRERMKVRLESAAMSLAQASEAAAQLADSRAVDGPELSLERVERLEQQLGEALQKLSGRGALSGLSPELQEQLQGLSANGRLQLPQEEAARRELLEQLASHLERENRKLSELRKKCSGCKSGRCEGDGECEGGLCQGASSANNSRPGRGGTTRGRADAELSWGDESDKQGIRFQETVLPKGFLDQPKDEIVGLKRTAPQEESLAEATRSEQHGHAAASGEATWNRKLTPRHRNAVRRYFGSQGATRGD